MPNVHALSLRHEFLKNGKHILNLCDGELMEVFFVLAILLELDLELSEDASECFVLRFESLSLLLQLLVFALHLAVYFV